MQVCRIRNPEGRFASAGRYAGFTTRGKVFQGLAAVKNHVRFIGGNRRASYADCTLVLYDCDTGEQTTRPMVDLFGEMNLR